MKRNSNMNEIKLSLWGTSPNGEDVMYDVDLLRKLIIEAKDEETAKILLNEVNRIKIENPVFLEIYFATFAKEAHNYEFVLGNTHEVEKIRSTKIDDVEIITHTWTCTTREQLEEYFNMAYKVLYKTSDSLFDVARSILPQMS